MAPGAYRGKRKPTRGGGKNFSRNLRPLNDEEPSDTRRNSGSENGSSEEESGDEDRPEQPAMTRDQRKALDRERKEAARAHAKAAASENEEDEDDDLNLEPIPVPTKAQGVGGIKVSNPNDPGARSSGLSRREREAVEAAAAKERYWKLQEAGKTDQARADLARLAIIRQEREEKAKQRKAELEEKKATAEAKADAKGGKRR